jgi:hypothetical protein
MRTRRKFVAPEGLEFYFTPTKDTPGEIRKAVLKNTNLPILQFWFNGNSKTPLKCLVLSKPAFLNFRDLVTKKDKQRFDCDFNHIRQYQDGNCYSGVSKDKGDKSPSDIFRTYDLSKPVNKDFLVEFMTTMTVCTEVHSYISQDSAKGHITLTSMKKSWWPWGLKNKKNFDKFCEKFNIDIDYDAFIDRLSDINWPDIVESYSRGTLSKSIVR